MNHVLAGFHCVFVWKWSGLGVWAPGSGADFDIHLVDFRQTINLAGLHFLHLSWSLARLQGHKNYDPLLSSVRLITTHHPLRPPQAWAWDLKNILPYILPVVEFTKTNHTSIRFIHWSIISTVGSLEFTLSLLSFPLRLFQIMRTLFSESEYFELPDAVISISCPGNPLRVQMLVVGRREGTPEEG